jgi:hypothetical protein
MAVKKTKIVDPKTGARVADPSFVGASLSSGGTGTSWPEVRSQYQKGQRSAEFNRKGVPAELKSYLTGKTNKLSEDFDEPFIRSGGDVSYTRTAKSSKMGEFKDTPKNEKMTKMATMKPTKIATGGSLKQAKPKSTATEGWFGDYVPSTKGVSNKQLKQFASYASKSNLGESFIASPKSSIDQYKGEMKSQRKQYAKEGNMAGVKATTADIRQARSASKFIGSKNPLDVPGMATGYRAAQENAANRNTIKAQVKSLKGYGMR